MVQKKDLKECVLELLEQNSRLPLEEMACLLNASTNEIAETMAQLEASRTVLKYTTIIDWEKTGSEKTNALIELTITPEREFGFDKIAERIYGFSEVKSLYLMSGSYDLAVFVEADSFKDISLFVAEKLAPLSPVKSTKTHFIMKKYKDHGVPYKVDEANKRLVVTP